MNRLLILVFCISSAVVRAQTSATSVRNELDAYWNVELTDDQLKQTVLVRSQTGIPDPSSAGNVVSLQQNGSSNRATVRIPSGTQNNVELNQANDGNATDAYLSGSGNSLIFSQTGGGNGITLGVDGSNNRFLLTQDGGDRMNMSGLQKNNTRLEVSQGSGNNSLSLDNTTLFTDPLGRGIPNLRIEQSGGASIQVTQGRVISN